MLFEAYLLFSVCKYSFFPLHFVALIISWELRCQQNNFDTGKADQANASSDVRIKKRLES